MEKEKPNMTGFMSAYQHFLDNIEEESIVGKSLGHVACPITIVQSILTTHWSGTH